MDCLIYTAILLIIGFIRMSTTQNVSDSVGIVDTGITTIDCDLPYSSNYELIKESGAFTLILEDLGLI